MTLPPELVPYRLDLLAFAYFVLVIIGYSYLATSRPLVNASIVDAVQKHRVAWMQNMAQRDNRVLDTILLGSLSQGNAFFASTSVIAIGGLSAMMGSGEKLQTMLERLPFVTHASPELWEAKFILLIGIFVYAFFKFAWAFRLSHYTAIMIGSTPLLNTPDAGDCSLHVKRTARLIGIAAEHANSGLRAYYYAIAAMAWFFHPLLFMALTTWMLIILIRRDFFSRSLGVLSGRWP